MFVQATKSKRGDKVYTSYLIRESFRTAQGPRSRTICNISALPESLRELITDSLSGKKFVATQDLELSDALDYGGLAVLDQAWQSFGLEGLFDQVSSVRHRQLLKAMVFGRILFPCSKLSLADHARGSLLAACCGLDQQSEHFDEDELYEAMDGLNAQWVGIEKKLFNQAFKDQSLTLVLYDLSSVYFEGKGPRGLARYGYSRDHRPDRTQVLLAVATDANGVPVHLEVLKGNRSDNTTLHGLL
jgi:hypothetical protein